MKTRQLLDPLAMWREAINRLEGGVNNVATRNMQTEPFAQALALVLRASLGTHHLFDKNLARLYERLGLPSRSEVEAIAAAMRRVEDKLDMLLPPPVPTHRPARTRRAPEVAPALAIGSAPAEANAVPGGVRAEAPAPVAVASPARPPRRKG